MNHLSKVIELLKRSRKDTGEREWIKEPLPGPNRPPRRWWNRTTREYRTEYPNLSMFEIAERVKKRWYSMIESDQKRIRQEMLREKED